MSNSKPKLLFIYDHPDPKNWLDGLSAALDLLEEDFEIERLNLHDKKQVGSYMVDCVLGWGAFGSKVDEWIRSPFNSFGRIEKEVVLGLCIAGNSFPPEGADNYDILFCETDYIKDVYLRGVTTKKVKAFGTNTDIFGPININTPIVWDYVGVGAFANWKRWEKMTEKSGNRLVIGEYQKDNEQESLAIVQHLLRNGIMVSPMVSPYDLALVYAYSRTLYQPADINGGGERSVLEALSCGLSVEIEDDNPKLKELLDNKIPTHHDYAKALKNGIMRVL